MALPPEIEKQFIEPAMEVHRETAEDLGFDWTTEIQMLVKGAIRQGFVLGQVYGYQRAKDEGNC